MRYKQSIRVCIPLCLIALAGCNRGPEIAGVTGRITMDGEPLTNATVVFIPKARGRPAGARTDSDGRYELNFSAGRKGTIPGMNRIRVTTLSDPYEDENGNRVPGSRETIPIEYNQQSTLKFMVESDKSNVADFDLVSGGKIMSDEGYGAGGYGAEDNYLEAVTAQ